MRLDKLATYVPRCASPPGGRGFIERMHDFELVRMRALERCELIAEQDVCLGHVGVQQREARLVRGFVESMFDELVQGRDTRSSADQRHVLKLVCYARGRAPWPGRVRKRERTEEKGTRDNSFLWFDELGAVIRRTFVREFGDGALDGERVIWLEPLMDVLAYHPILIFLNKQHELALLIRARNRRICAHGQIALLVHGRIRTAFRRAHDDERGDGRECRATVGQLEDEARRVVVVRLDRFELEVEETLGVQRGFFLLLIWLGRGSGGGGEWSWGTAEVEVCAETCETRAA